MTNKTKATEPKFDAASMATAIATMAQSEVASSAIGSDWTLAVLTLAPSAVSYADASTVAASAPKRHQAQVIAGLCLTAKTLAKANTDADAIADKTQATKRQARAKFTLGRARGDSDATILSSIAGSDKTLSETERAWADVTRAGVKVETAIQTLEVLESEDEAKLEVIAAWKAFAKLASAIE